MFTVTYLMAQFADDIGLAPATVETYRWVAGHWPKEHRVSQVPFEVHRILLSADDPFEVIKHPPDGRRWTPDAARRVVGRRPETAVSAQERVEAIHKLAPDDHVAARVATDFLRRPQVAARVVADPTARYLVNSAQVDRSGMRGTDAVVAPELRCFELEAWERCRCVETGRQPQPPCLTIGDVGRAGFVFVHRVQQPCRVGS
ncbi:DUF6192 family protein [Nocardia sp. CDC159]|uniref:DUF6192 family protein n=1 Tax=Nocardia pulmonis TaxID=2951408 RepID=A0A9X2E6H9_9NOCA|nr:MULTISPECIES: DUF6192 family protein [Nocardia]MCM6774545.1 DUF6192 family protein [Nocardia pulmonis]MCM6787389.1 DUF6192 family protein [Nocardia sp. CDC159]